MVDLCDAILREPASRQHRFDWLRLGDPGRDGRRRTLPVDAYYTGHRLVIEYRERQHEEPVAHFDKPDMLTVSGVHRGIQRRYTTTAERPRFRATGSGWSSSGRAT